MKYFAIVSDIHANRPALESIIRDAEEIAGGCSLSFINLGDVLDYGPHPNDCMKKIMEDDRFVLNVCGNHDEECKKEIREPIMAIREDHWAFTLWTRRELLPKYRDAIRKNCIRNHVSNDPIPELRGFSFIHGGLHEHFSNLADSDIPTTKPVTTVDDAKRQFKYLNDRSAFVGHTHYQGYFVLPDFEDTPEMYFAIPAGCLNGSSVPKSLFEVSKEIIWGKFPEQRFILNPGSVGQPRWHGIIKGTYPKIYFPPMACYALVRVSQKKMEFAFRQVEYDFKTIIDDLEKVIWPENTTKQDTKIVARLLSKEHSAYRQEPETTADILYLKMKDSINEKLQHEIKYLIRTIDPIHYQE